MSERVIKVPASDGDSYWLNVTVDAGLEAGYVRTVGVAPTATPGSRAKAHSLAGFLGVAVDEGEAESWEAVSQHTPAEPIDFTNPAPPTLRPPFNHGSQEGKRLR